jgi:hypothetical protein
LFSELKKLDVIFIMIYYTVEVKRKELGDCHGRIDERLAQKP